MHPYLQGPFRAPRPRNTALAVDPAAFGVLVLGGLALIAVLVGMF